MKRILVIQLRRLGDVICATPTLDVLRRAYPDAAIDFLVEKPADRMLEGDPAARILRYDPKRTLGWLAEVRRTGYDAAVDLFGNPRSALLTFATGAPLRAGPGHVFHRWAYNRLFPRPRPDVYVAQAKADNVADAFGVARIQARTRLTIPPDADAEAARLWTALGLDGAPFVLGVFPANRRPIRQWPEDHTADVLRGLMKARSEARVLLFWGPGEEATARRIVARAPGTLSIPDVKDLKVLLGLMRRVHFGFGNDNGPRHMFQAIGVPTFTVFGPTKPGTWNPPDAARYPYIRREELFCIACDLTECPYKHECMTGLAPARVLASLLESLPAPAAQPVEAAC